MEHSRYYCYCFYGYYYWHCFLTWLGHHPYTSHCQNVSGISHLFNTPHTRCRSQFRFANSTKSSIYLFPVWKKPWPVLLSLWLELSLSSHISCAGWCCMLSCTPSINGYKITFIKKKYTKKWTLQNGHTSTYNIYLDS